ncbi:MAG: hypothetical protein SFU27_06450 [Thermonemataceae bacterium]|nr:hypothetical protein [Thermonemataceae bacterium]
MKKLSELATKLKEAQKNAIKEIAITAQNHYKDKFTEGKGVWEGKAWKEPIRKNGAIKRKKGSGYWKGRSPRDASRTTLVGKGVLQRSLKHQIKGNVIRFYSNVKYAGYHNEGTEKLPKRQFLGMEKPLQTKINKIILDNFSF